MVIEVGNGWVDDGLNLWYVESDRDAAFCRLVCRSIDFQQLNGRRVGFWEIMALVSSGNDCNVNVDA